MSEKMKAKLMSDSMSANLQTLTKKERKYFSIMWAKYGVLNITSKPGIAKSAIGRAIAEKMGFAYSDLRLSMIDETDIGLYPNVSEIETGNLDPEGNPTKVKCLDFGVHCGCLFRCDCVGCLSAVVPLKGCPNRIPL